MKKNNIKWLLTIYLFVFAQNVLSQSQPFTLSILKDNIYKCEMDSSIKPNTALFDYAKLAIQSGYNHDTRIDMAYMSGKEDLVALLNTIKKSENVNNWGRINIVLENNEILYGTDVILNDEREDVDKRAGIGVVSIHFLSSGLKSNKVSMNSFSDIQKEQYISQQLRNYSIVKLIFNNNDQIFKFDTHKTRDTFIDVTIDFDTFKTKDTFDAMFNALGAKIDDPDRFRFNSSSSSSSTTTAKPTASANIGYLTVLSNGFIGCRLDNLKISNAKGKNVKIWAFFEDVSSGVSDMITGELVPSDNEIYYDSFIVRGNVSQLKVLNNRNSCRFKVYVWFVIAGPKQRIIGETREKYITIFKSSRGWDSR